MLCAVRIVKPYEANLGFMTVIHKYPLESQRKEWKNNKNLSMWCQHSQEQT